MAHRIPEDGLPGPEAIKEIALNDPLVHAALSYYEAGHVNYEQMLRLALVALFNQKEELLAKVLTIARNEPLSPRTFFGKEMEGL